MSQQMSTLETERLIIRPLTMDDLQTVHQILDLELKDTDFGTEGTLRLNERERWLQWTILNYEQLSKLNQPPYGERGVFQKQSNRLIGICGFVPCLDCFEQLSDNDHNDQIELITTQSLATTEFGLFYSIAKNFQGCGLATEAAFSMINYAFEQLYVKRIVATTTFDNAASIAVMRKLGMQIKRNNSPKPTWLQIVGFLHNKIINR